MKKYIIYIGILSVGLFLGWLLFGSSSTTETTHNHEKVTETNALWTCSMHPQIMQPEAGDCPICGMDLIPAESNADGLQANQFKLTKNAMALANIQTSIVGNTTTKNNGSKLSGKIVENEEVNAVQVSYFSGRIERLNVNFTGEEIRKGQLLATIYSPELYAAQQELITAASLKESQPALYKAVRNKLKLWKLSEKQIQQIETSGKVKENFPVYATVSGTVTEKLVNQGDYIKQGQPLLKIANLSTVWANFDVYENQLKSFKKGQEVRITSNAYPTKEFKGKVAFIDPILNTNTRTVTLRVVLNNDKKIFKPGMFVQATIDTILTDEKTTLTIPASTILWTGKRSVVYIKSNTNEPIFEMREVVLGAKIGDEYEITKGLSAGNEIVTNGTFTVDAAAQLRGKKSMMNKTGDKVMTDHEGHSMNKKEQKRHFDATIETFFQNIINVYVELKDALIQSDISLAAAKSETFRKALEAIPMSQRKKTHPYWDTLHKTSKGIHETVNLAQQRKQFQLISNTLIEMVKNFNKLDSKLFVQFCPMANDDKGAYWLSKEEKVLNPYFGDMMLTCGEVKQVLNKTSK